jgi:hypothetical protein
VIPAHDVSTLALPPGRYITTLDEIEQRFVVHEEFATSATRVRNWAGFRRYVDAWGSAEKSIGQKILLGFWIAGSFVTTKPDPNDVDVTPLYDLKALKAANGKPGSGQIKKLIGNRDSVARSFHVEAFPLPWSSTGSSLFPEKLPADEQSYLLSAGGLDDWWQRLTRRDAAGGPVHAETPAEKGYLEVIL